MLKLEHAPSAIPDELGRTTFLVIDASRCKGHVFREVPIHSTDLEEVLTDLIEGQYVEPVRVVGFNVEEGWSRDVSAEVARIIKRRQTSDRRSLPKSLCKFIAERSTSVETRPAVRIRPDQRRTARMQTLAAHDHDRMRPYHLAPAVAE